MSRPAANPVLALLPDAKRAILSHLYDHATATVADLVDVLGGCTPSNVRQHMDVLADVGAVTHTADADGPGRPTHHYALTDLTRTSMAGLDLASAMDALELERDV